MNGIERISAAMRGERADRRAVAPVLSIYGAGLTGCSLEHYFNDSAAYADGQCAILETFSPDILFGPFCLAKEGLPFGSEIRYFPNLPPNLIRPASIDPLALSRLPLEQLLSHPAVTYQEEAIAALLREVGASTIVAPILLNPLDLPVMIYGLENWLQMVLFDPDQAKAVLELSVPYFIARCNRLFDMGAAMVVTSAVFVNSAILTPQLVRDLALPVLERAYSALQGPLVLHSTGIPLLPLIEALSGLPALAGFVANPGENLQQLRQLAGPERLLDGNIDGPALVGCQADNVYRQACALIEEQADDPRFLLGTSGADIPLETPAENIHALLHAAEAMGEAYA